MRFGNRELVPLRADISGNLTSHQTRPPFRLHPKRKHAHLVAEREREESKRLGVTVELAAWHTKEGFQMSLPHIYAVLASPSLSPSTIMEIEMPPRQERRESERVPCKGAYPYELMKPADAELSEGHGHSINRSIGGMLLLLPEKVNRRQVFEIQVPSKASKESSTKLVEVCWTRPIPVSARVKMYLAGTRFLFELPAPGQSPQTR